MSNIGLKDGRTLLKTAGAKLRSQQAEIMTLKAKVAEYEQNERIVKIAQEMEEKGLNNELTMEAKVAHLKQAKDLNVTEEAVKMASPQGNLLGETSDVAGGANSEETLATFIMTGEDIRD